MSPRVLSRHWYALALSILLTVTGALAPAAPLTCSELFETSSWAWLPRFPLPEENQWRMVSNEQRSMLLRRMLGPPKWRRALVLSKFDGSPGAAAKITQRTRNIREYLAKHKRWSGYQKAIVWETFVEDINAYNPSRSTPGEMFHSGYHAGSDGSFMFQSWGPFVLVFTREGRIFTGRIDRMLEPREIWAADYSALKEVQ